MYPLFYNNLNEVNGEPFQVILSLSFRHANYLISCSFHELTNQCNIMTYNNKITLYANIFSVLFYHFSVQ